MSPCKPFDSSSPRIIHMRGTRHYSIDMPFPTVLPLRNANVRDDQHLQDLCLTNIYLAPGCYGRDISSRHHLPRITLLYAHWSRVVCL